MKRIHYGNITLDVADEVGDTLIELVDELAGRSITRSVNVGPGQFASQAYAVGRQSFEQISGYLNGSENETDVWLWLGGAVPIAIAPQYPTKNDPSGTPATLARLREWLGESAD